MSYIGDYALSSVIYTKFSTATAAGVPTTLSGSPVVKIYKANSTSTESTSGVTLTVDFDSVTGLNHLTIDTSSDGTFYAAGNNFQAIITTGTVGGTSVVGAVVAEFSLNAVAALRPATAGRTLVVDSAGLADANTVKIGPSGSGTAQTAGDVGIKTGFSLANLTISGSPTIGGTGTLTITGAVATQAGTLPITTSTMKADVDTIKTQTVTCSASVTVSPFVGSTGAAVNGTTVNTLAGHDPGATLGTSTYAGADTSGTTALLLRLTSTRAGYLDYLTNLDATISSRGTSTLTAAGVWDYLTSSATTAGSVGKRIVDFVTTLVYIAPPSANDNADALLDRANGIESSLTLRGAMRLISAAAVGKASISGNTVTFRNVGDTKDRITATTDTNGQRTAITTDAT